MIDRPPQVNHFAVQLDVHLVKVPSSLPKTAYPADPLVPDIGREDRPEPAPPQSHRLVTQVDPTLEQQVFHITTRQGGRASPLRGSAPATNGNSGTAKQAFEGEA